MNSFGLDKGNIKGFIDFNLSSLLLNIKRSQKIDITMSQQFDYSSCLQRFYHSSFEEKSISQPIQANYRVPRFSPESLQSPLKKSNLQEEKYTNSIQPAISVSQKVKQINNSKIKNSLAMFKTAHFRYLRREGIKLEYYQELVNFKAKVGAAKYDFVKIYKISALQQVWAKMFQSKYMYQYIMRSRAFPKFKKAFMVYLKRLQKAFQTRRRF